MPKLSYRMILIGDAPAGLLGLEELFEALYEAGTTPDDPDIAMRLLKGVRQENFIPKPALDDYRAVLVREYHQYYLTRQSGQASTPRDYGQWEGHPRENIPWFPSISPELCDGCGKCIEVCPKAVFVIAPNGKATVVEPFSCIVGCCFCKSACVPQAILMPLRKMLDQYRTGLMGR